MRKIDEKEKLEKLIEQWRKATEKKEEKKEKGYGQGQGKTGSKA